jgi:hypothetical protein
MSEQMTVGQRVHDVDNPTDTGTVTAVHETLWGPWYSVSWDSNADESDFSYSAADLTPMPEPQLWIAIRGVYQDARPVGIAASEEEAREMIRAAVRADYPGDEDAGDPLDDWANGQVLGPFKLGELTDC